MLPTRETSHAAWYTNRLKGFGGRVDQILPSGFPAYARILHPVEGPGSSQALWSEVAASGGARLDPFVQFSALAGTDAPISARQEWAGWAPAVGNLKLPQLRSLADILARHTKGAGICWLALWTGYAGLPRAWQVIPKVLQPSRAYYLFKADVHDLIPFSVDLDRIQWESLSGETLPSASATATSTSDKWPQSPEGSGPSQSPNQWWPDDHGWCVATGVDLDSTLVAGPDYVIEEILTSNELESLEVAPSHDLSSAH